MKYIGSKSAIAKDIVPILQELIDNNDIKTYIEPFVGGFNVIDKVVCEHKIGSDIDNLVIDLVESATCYPNLLDFLTETPTKKHYYDVRDNAWKYESWYRAAVLLFGSYNARVYGGCYGATAKTKDGKIRDYFQEAKRNFEKQLPNLKGILTACCDYRQIIPPKHTKALIYCDIPYADGVGYSQKFDTDAFWEWCRVLSMQGHIVIVSEHNAPDDFKCIWQKDITSHLNNRNKLQKCEKLFIYGGIKQCKNL